MQPEQPTPAATVRGTARVAEAAEKATQSKFESSERAAYVPQRNAYRSNREPAAALPSDRSMAEQSYRAPNEVVRRSAANAPAPAPTPDVGKERALRTAQASDRVRNDSRASDLDVLAQYAQLGDRVEVDADTVSPLERQDRHQFIYDHGLQGVKGRVVGSKIEGGIYYLQVETPNASAWVPAECVRVVPDVDNVVPSPPHQAPERMRKHKPGSYTQT